MMFYSTLFSGRFEEAVVEERRQSALALLNFIGTQPHLYKSKTLAEFLAVSDDVYCFY
jgi:hypothetical protein